MINKSPKWNEQMQAYCLNFGGRVTKASVKNFQLVAADQQDRNILQFGKVGKDTFTMDYSWPINALQAFALCLTSFDNKVRPAPALNATAFSPARAPTGTPLADCPFAARTRARAAGLRVGPHYAGRGTAAMPPSMPRRVSLLAGGRTLIDWSPTLAEQRGSRGWGRDVHPRMCVGVCRARPRTRGSLRARPKCARAAAGRPRPLSQPADQPDLQMSSSSATLLGSVAHAPRCSCHALVHSCSYAPGRRALLLSAASLCGPVDRHLFAPVGSD